MHKRKRLILLAIIFVSLAAVGYKVAESIWVMKAREFRKDPLKALEHLPESALHIRDFRRAKIEDGRKVWELFGDEASYFKEQKEAVIKKPRFYYYDKDGETAETTGDTAHLFFTERELEKMQLELASKKLRLVQNVKTKVEPDKLAKRNKMANNGMGGG